MSKVTRYVVQVLAILVPVLVGSAWMFRAEAQQNQLPRGDYASSLAVQAVEQCFDPSGAFICGGPQLVLRAGSTAPTYTPAAGSVSFHVDDNVDYSGGGGNDCAFISRDHTGNVTTIAVLVLNGACP